MTKKRKKIKPGKPDPKIFAAAWHILPQKFHKQTFVILALTLIGTILETVGIGFVMPAIALMADPNIAEKYPVLLPLFEALGNPSHAELVIYGVALLLGAYVIKALYLAFLSWKQSQYIYEVKAYLSRGLFERYIRSPYEFHLQQNSGHLIRNITIEVEQLVGRVLIPGVLLVTELMVIAAIATLLFVIQPLGALVLSAVMGVAMYGFQRITQNNLKKMGH
jgi:ABC-type multidrug transport system fused ATPase/permease subunit